MGSQRPELLSSLKSMNGFWTDARTPTALLEIARLDDIRLSNRRLSNRRYLLPCSARRTSFQ